MTRVKKVNSRVEREIPISKIESRKRIVSCHSRKSRVEREMETIKFSRSREKFLFLLSIFLLRARLSSMPGLLDQKGYLLSNFVIEGQKMIKEGVDY